MTLGARRKAETVYGDVTAALFGQVLAVAGDVNQDGISDLVISAPKNTPKDGAAIGVKAAGSVYLYSRGDSLALLQRLDGKRKLDAFGSAIDAGHDLNGDGVADIVVGAPLADVLASTGKTLRDAGSVYAIDGATFAELSVSMAAPLNSNLVKL